ncbi:MAG: hypothetical protein MMC33_009271 [Icmadophila ericetorum]|nr:hypothetical protein [Icmadophila ericetorum]
MHSKSLVAVCTSLALIISPIAAALSVNCRGGFVCLMEDMYITETLTAYLEMLDPDDYFYEGSQIACYHNVCAFVQNADGAYGDVIQDAARSILRHGCLTCGSAPLGYPNVTDVTHGELTYNAVSDSCRRDGICPA